MDDIEHAKRLDGVRNNGKKLCHVEQIVGSSTVAIIKSVRIKKTVKSLKQKIHDFVSVNLVFLMVLIIKLVILTF